MTQAAGRNAIVVIWDSTGACHNLSGDMNNVVLTWLKDNPDSTTFGHTMKQRLSNIRDATLSGTAIWNSSASAIDQTLNNILSTSQISQVKFMPNGSSVNIEAYSACMQLQSYAITTPLNGATAIAYTFQSSSGSMSPIPQFLLYDAFTTAISAGSVNGTLSESPLGTGGSVTRTAVDAENKLSITGGQLSFSGGKVTPAWGDPGYWSSVVTRQLGLALLARINRSTGAGPFGPQVGFDTDQTGTGEIGGNALYFGATGNIQLSSSGANLVNVAQYSVDILYQVAVVLRSTGAYYFIKGDVFTYWTLLGYVNINNTSSLYPAIIDYNVAFVADDLRLPVSLYIPKPLAYDSFTRANGALGSTETIGPDSQSTPSLAWTDQAGTWAISTNAAAASALAGSLAFSTIATSSADVIIDAAVTRSAGVAGMVARYQSSTDYLIAYHDGTNAKLDKVVSGSTTNLISAAATYSAGAALRLILSGTEARLFYNAAAVGALATAPASTFSAHGLYTTDTGNTLDNFTVWARGTSNEFGTLDSY